MILVNRSQIYDEYEMIWPCVVDPVQWLDMMFDLVFGVVIFRNTWSWIVQPRWMIIDSFQFSSFYCECLIAYYRWRELIRVTQDDNLGLFFVVAYGQVLQCNLVLYESQFQLNVCLSTYCFIFCLFIIYLFLLQPSSRHGASPTRWQSAIIELSIESDHQNYFLNWIIVWTEFWLTNFEWNIELNPSSNFELNCFGYHGLSVCRYPGQYSIIHSFTFYLCKYVILRNPPVRQSLG